MKICMSCNLSFTNSKSYSNHVRWVHKKIGYHRVCCIYCKIEVRCEYVNKHTEKCLHKKHCKNCCKELKNIKSTFCNNSCSATYNNSRRNKNKDYITEEWKEKMRQHAIRQWNTGIHNVSKRQIFSSKKEREIVSYFKENFPSDQWKSGGRLKLSDEERLSRDLWSDKLKICFEYDGIWHFKNIHGQLFKKQLKDRLLEQWCIVNNYRLIRIDEEFYNNVQQIKELVYENQDPIIKIGNRY